MNKCNSEGNTPSDVARHHLQDVSYIVYLHTLAFQHFALNFVKYMGKRGYEPSVVFSAGMNVPHSLFIGGIGTVSAN